MAKDLYHNAVRNALIKDGWTITHDPLRLEDNDRLQNYPFILHLMEKHKIKTFIFDEFNENIISWKK